MLSLVKACREQSGLVLEVSGSDYEFIQGDDALSIDRQNQKIGPFNCSACLIGRR
jgi:hypothetical protein